MSNDAHLLGNSESSSLAIGSMTIDGRAFLAPMSGITDVGMRRIARRFGASLVVSEMVACDDYALAKGRGLTHMSCKLPVVTPIGWGKPRVSQRPMARR